MQLAVRLLVLVLRQLPLMGVEACAEKLCARNLHVLLRLLRCCYCCCRAGLRAELAAVQQVRSRSGEFATLLGKGPSAVRELQRQSKDAEAAMMLLKHSSLKHLIQEVADLNDCHIVVVGWEGGHCCGLACFSCTAR